MSRIKRHMLTAARRADSLIAGQTQAECVVRSVLAEHRGFWRRAGHLAALILVLNRANRPALARAVVLAIHKLW